MQDEAVSDRLGGLRSQARAAFQAADWAASCRLYGELLRDLGDERPLWPEFRALRTSADRLPAEERSEVWQGTWFEDAALAAQSMTMMEQGDTEGAVRAFATLAQRRFPDPVVRDLWQGAFAAVYGLPDPDQATHPSLGAPAGKHKIIASGKGWSGSSAVFDYVKEFAGVDHTGGEFRFIEGDPGLWRVWDAVRRQDRWRDAFTRFFWIGLLGLGGWRNSREWQAAQMARRLSLRASAPAVTQYAEAVRRFCQGVARADDDGGLTAVAFAPLATGLVDEVVGIGKSQSTIVLDNVIHAQNIRMSEVLDDAVLLCVFRDPRSEFVDRRRDMNQSVEHFVEEFRRSSRRFEEGLGQLPSDRVQVISFERFVVSRRYRRSIARAAGLAVEGAAEYQFFQPWKSAKNVCFFEHYPNQEEIRYIERELPEHLVDVPRLRLAAAWVTNGWRCRHALRRIPEKARSIAASARRTLQGS